MIPVPRTPGDLPLPPEEPVPVARSSQPTSLILLALDEIEAIKKSIEALKERMDALEHRVAGLAQPLA